MSSFPTLALKPNKMFMWHLRSLNGWFQFRVEAVLYVISIVIYWGMNAQNNDVTPATS
jgi:hypothetical protein